MTGKYRARKKLIFTILFIIFLAFNAKFFISCARSLKNLYRLSRLTPEQKYKLIDGKFYDFVKLCEKSIPENAKVLIINNSQNLKEHTSEWVKSEYIKQKLPYYLYPRSSISRDLDQINDKNNYYRVIYEISSRGIFFKLYDPD